MIALARFMLKGLAVAACGLLFVLASNVYAGKKIFDHSTTGFELVGAHSLSACENCHAQGQFGGTPRQCEGCHNINGRYGATAQPVNHIPVTGQCDSCHQPIAWQGVVLMDHTQALGECFQCHNNLQVAGQPLDHINTVKDCEGCHSSTLSWAPVPTVDHGLVIGECASCHNNVTVVGKPINHINTTSECGACHTNRISFAPVAVVDHDFVLPQDGCTSCHNGVIAKGQFVGHPETGSTQCSACHTSRITFSF